MKCKHENLSMQNDSQIAKCDNSRKNKLKQCFQRKTISHQPHFIPGANLREDTQTLYFADVFYSQQSIARKNSSDGKIEYIMASMLIVLLDVW